jgi:hypothetical protein
LFVLGQVKSGSLAAGWDWPAVTVRRWAEKLLGNVSNKFDTHDIERPTWLVVQLKLTHPRDSWMQIVAARGWEEVGLSTLSVVFLAKQTPESRIGSLYRGGLRQSHKHRSCLPFGICDIQNRRSFAPTFGWDQKNPISYDIRRGLSVFRKESDGRLGYLPGLPQGGLFGTLCEAMPGWNQGNDDWPDEDDNQLESLDAAAEHLTCLILKMSKTGAAASTFSRSSGGSLSMGGNVAAETMILRVAVDSFLHSGKPFLAKRVLALISCLDFDRMMARHLGITGEAEVQRPTLATMLQQELTKYVLRTLRTAKRLYR